MSYWQQLPWRLCGLAYPNHQDVEQCAIACLQLFDQNASGSLHCQAQRFLSPTWNGIPGFGADSDPPLRDIVEQLASGDLQLPDVLEASRTGDAKAKSFCHWVAAFRLVRALLFVVFFVCFS